ncbi:O-antigen ligase family protein [Rhizobium sp. CC-YZS058]|uniref:O-antigen ligase family protein n=1 Tax=Rhizobium sp. CC-YZS058 TaxID=3042153 RepID=UPI002B05E24D|nr:O-antigen ligase family protein [Rhizobium sp. CC-YZS058]MEA3535454.1 O-antigen ligase family protein [Rhizobium sp. CC-YZS058]
MNQLRRKAAGTGEADLVVPDFVAAMPMYPPKILPIPAKFLALFAFGVGFLLQCNVITNSIGLRLLHISDLIVLVGLPVLYVVYVRLLASGPLILHLVVLSFSFLLSVMLFHERGEGEFYTSIFTYLYTLFFLPFTYMLFKERLLTPFCWGIFYGFSAAAMLLGLDLVLHDQLSSIGLAFVFDPAAVAEALARGEITSALRLEKAGGIWAHGNEAGPVFALAAAAAAYLAEKKQNFWIFTRFTSIYLSTFTLTQNRSGLIAVILVGLVLYIRRLSMATLKRSFFTIIAVAIGVIVVLPFGVFDFVDSAISKRFLEDSNVSNNASERFSSLGHGFEVMFQYPFGIGYTARYNLMQAIGGIGSPHNGFLATAFANGLVYVVLLVTTILYLAVRRRKIGFFAYAAAALVTVYMFEELSYNPCMMAFVALMISYVALDLDFRLARAGAVLRLRSSRKRLAGDALHGRDSGARPGGPFSAAPAPR